MELCMELKEYQMDMHTDSGEKYRFILTGLQAFYPNRSGRCGSGADDWFFHCICNQEDCVLNFKDDASYGTSWACVFITAEEAQQLQALSVKQCAALMVDARKIIYHLHPDEVASAKKAMKINYSRKGHIDDEAFYGR